MVQMSWIIRFRRNRISNIEEADGSGDSWNCTMKMWELGARYPSEIEGILFDTDLFEGLLDDIESFEGIIHDTESFDGTVYDIDSFEGILDDSGELEGGV
jgi:hypothetical protein